MTKTITNSILFLFGLAENPIHSASKKSDEDSLKSDWQTVGKDMIWAIRNYERE